MSVTQARSVVGQVKELWDPARDARQVAAYRQGWVDGDIPWHDKPTMPAKAPEDLKKIAETGLTPNARMVVNQVSQQMRVEGIRLADSADSAPAWDIWLRNGMTGKQIPLVKAVLAQGLSYSLVTPAVGRLDGKPTAALRLRDAQRSTAFFRDDFDEWPEFYIDVTDVKNNDGRDEQFIEFVDEGYVHRLSCPKDEPDKLVYIDNYQHGMDLCPVQRFGMVGLDGSAPGIISPLIGLLKRIDQDTVDRLVVQRFASWVVRTIAGLKKPTAPTPQEEAAIEEALYAWLQVGDFLTSDSPDTKFGHIPATPMDGHIRARESDIRDLAGASQVPAYRLLGLSDNIGAEAIAAADAGLDRHADEFMTVLGEQYEGQMRLAGHAAGLTEVAQDYTSRIQWATISTTALQSLAQALQALHDSGEGMPYELLWPRIPGITQNDITRALKLREEERQRKQEEAMAQAALGSLTEGGFGGGNRSDAARGDASSRAGAARG
jgi:hypothetical protein